MRKDLWIPELCLVAFVLYSQVAYYLLEDNLNASISGYNFSHDNIISDIYNCNYNSHNDSIMPNTIRGRAILMSNVVWIPKSDVPNNLGYFGKGENVVGLPYSSVKELQKFIGLDVSIYTFLTAVNNPYSLLYTEDVAKGKPCYLGGVYNGKNSHAFYGTVCSSFTAFCYGENNNYTSFNYRNGDVPNYFLKSDQSIDGISAGDLFWCPGHVALITDVEKDSLGYTNRIELFESAGDKVYSRMYTPSSFSRRLSGNGNIKKKGYLYRNKLVEASATIDGDCLKNNDIQMLLESLPIENKDICTWFGDKPCIGEWDKLMINFNKKDNDRIIIYKNDEIIDTLDISEIKHSLEYKFAGVGTYKAQLASDTLMSPDYTCFEVIDTTTKLRNIGEGLLEVIFADNSEPEIIYWVNKSGEQHTFPITVPNSAKKKGKMIIKSCDKKDAILRVIYRGRYGRAINKPTHLFPKVYKN